MSPGVVHTHEMYYVESPTVGKFKLVVKQTLAYLSSYSLFTRACLRPCRDFPENRHVIFLTIIF